VQTRSLGFDTALRATQPALAWQMFGQGVDSMAWMYILRCADDSYYVGSTVDLERRLWEHNEGIGAKYTARRRPVELVYAAEFDSVVEAYEHEKQVQGWSRAKREPWFAATMMCYLLLRAKILRNGNERKISVGRVAAKRSFVRIETTRVVQTRSPGHSTGALLARLR
jgi:putative endonuclease